MPQEEKEAPQAPKVDSQVEEKSNEPLKKKSEISNNTKLLIALIIISVALLVGCGILVYRACNQLNREPVVYRQNQTISTPKSSTNIIYVQRDNITSVSGVVVSVDDSSFVIAGNGERTTIKTDSDTTYNTEDSKVAVNDSVVIYGTKSDGVITAVSVQVYNQ